MIRIQIALLISAKWNFGYGNKDHPIFALRTRPHFVAAEVFCEMENPVIKDKYMLPAMPDELPPHCMNSRTRIPLSEENSRERPKLRT